MWLLIILGLCWHPDICLLLVLSLCPWFLFFLISPGLIMYFKKIIPFYLYYLLEGIISIPQKFCSFSPQPQTASKCSKCLEWKPVGCLLLAPFPTGTLCTKYLKAIDFALPSQASLSLHVSPALSSGFQGSSRHQCIPPRHPPDPVTVRLTLFSLFPHWRPLA